AHASLPCDAHVQFDLLLQGYRPYTPAGPGPEAPALDRAAEALASLPPGEVLRWGWVSPGAFTLTWDSDPWHECNLRQVQIVREAGALSDLPTHLHSLGVSFASVGDFAGAASVIAEATSVASATGTPVAPYTELRLRALQGREEDARVLMATTLEIGAALGHEFATNQANWAAAVLYNGLGRYDEALAAGRSASAQRYDPFVGTLVLPELVEAAIHGGELV